MQSIEHYTLETQVGAGAMGTVWRATDSRNGDVVAIKQLKREKAADFARFEREAAILKALDHPNIVGLRETVSDGDDYCIVLDFIEGGSLRDVLRNLTQLPLHVATTYARQIAAALAHAHERHIIHRDLKPSNVLLNNGQAVLTDFGVAFLSEGTRLTQSTALIGTDAYLSPEACYSLEPDPRTDLWSLGVMLFEMLAGRRPFAGDNIGAMVTAILTQDAPDVRTLRADVPEDVAKLIGRLLEKERDFRVRSATEVVQALELLTQAPSGTATLRVSAQLPGAAVRHNLPSFPTSFVGRAKSLPEIMTMLSNPDCRLVTITGAGGMGKTRLSTEIGRRLLDDFPDGVYFVPLQQVQGPEAVLPAIAEALELELVPGGNPLTQLQNYFRSKRLLLIVDNFEHVLEAAELIGSLLDQADHLKMIATSREALNIGHEWHYALRGLSVPQSASDDFDQFSAIRMFTQRAQRAKRDFDPQTERDCMQQIVTLVEGMPLGIELAAAWLKRLPCQRIAAEIAKNVDFLASRQRDSTERHQSMRAVFNHSWQLLTADEQRTLARVSVFRGGFTEAAAMAVAETDFWTLVALVDKSLLRMDETGRYDMHRLLQQYTQSHLEADANDFDAACERHTAHFLGWLQNEGYHLMDNHAIDAEVENLLLAVQNAVRLQLWTVLEDILSILVETIGNGPHIGVVEKMFDELLMADDLPASLRGVVTLYRIVLDQHFVGSKTTHVVKATEALALIPSPPVKESHIACLIVAGNILGDVDADTAARYLEQAVVEARRHGYWHTELQALRSLAGSVYMVRGDIEAAITLFLRGLELLDDTMQLNLLVQYTFLANAERRRHNTAAASGWIELALRSIPRRNSHNTVRAYSTAAQLAVEAGEINRSVALLEEAIRIAKEIGLDHLIMGVRRNYAYCLWTVGAYERALIAYQEVVDTSDYSQQAWMRVFDNINLANIVAMLGRYREAWRYYHEALNYSDYPLPEQADKSRAQALMGMGTVLAVLNQVADGIAVIDAATQSSAIGQGDLRYYADIFLRHLGERLGEEVMADAREHAQTMTFEEALQYVKEVDIDVLIEAHNSQS